MSTVIGRFGTSGAYRSRSAGTAIAVTGESGLHWGWIAHPATETAITASVAKRPVTPLSHRGERISPPISCKCYHSMAQLGLRQHKELLSRLRFAIEYATGARAIAPN